jgi:hypothetical protein
VIDRYRVLDFLQDKMPLLYSILAVSSALPVHLPAEPLFALLLLDFHTFATLAIFCMYLEHHMSAVHTVVGSVVARM